EAHGPHSASVHHQRGMKTLDLEVSPLTRVCARSRTTLVAAEPSRLFQTSPKSLSGAGAALPPQQRCSDGHQGDPEEAEGTDGKARAGHGEGGLLVDGGAEDRGRRRGRRGW